MKISLITVCYNSASTIRDTIESILNQTYFDIEYILVDGDSKDETVCIIKEYEPLFKGRMRWISEPDNGLYDAMNKGIRMANGDIIGILNSDDRYASMDILLLVNRAIVDNNLDSCYGNLLCVKRNKPYRYWEAGIQESFKFGWMPPHPAFFVKRNVYEKYGVFRLDCGVNADYELMFRFLDIYKISTMWINRVFVYMNAGGKSDANLKARFDAINDNRISWRVNNINPFFFTLFLKRLRKIPQFFKAKFYQV
jgi:glycosyltransferase involved in cell wall biosynthesis